MPMQVDEWIIYDTALKIENARELAGMHGAIVIFASPSAVRAFTEAGGDWKAIRVEPWSSYFLAIVEGV